MADDRLPCWNPSDPLERIEKPPEVGLCGETLKAHQALLDYWSFGAGRSLRKLHRSYTEPGPDGSKPTDIPTRHLSTLKGWSGKWFWQDRITTHLAIEREKALVRWRERQDEIRAADDDQGQRLRERVDQMLRFPLSEQQQERIVQQDETTVIQMYTVNPVGWRLRDIPRMLEAASKLQRQASGLETTGRETKLNIDLSQLTDDQVERIANGEDPLHVLATPGSSGEGAAKS